MTKAELARIRGWRLRVLQQAGEGSRNVARTCRHFGISRQAFCRWKRRYEAHGEAGLWDRARRPHRSPRATPREVVGKILYLRQHYQFGPRKIADYLGRFHFTAIDDCTRIRVLKVYDACNQRTAIRFADEVLRRLPFRVHVVQTDNGAEFQSQFHWQLETRDIRHVYIGPRTPHPNGKVGRSHRVDDQEFYQLLDKDGISDDIHLFNEQLREWDNYYHYHRPHGALDGQTPYERLVAKMRAGASPASWDSTSSWHLLEPLCSLRPPLERPPDGCNLIGLERGQGRRSRRRAEVSHEAWVGEYCLRPCRLPSAW